MDTGSKNLPLLLPVQVPWQISASAAFLRAEPTELLAEQPITVDFVAYFGARQPDGEISLGTRLEIVQSPPSFQPSLEGEQARYHQVRVEFRRGHTLRLNPAISESRVIDDSSYDWSKVPGRLLQEENVDAHLQRVRDLWLRTGICPNPRMYEVAHSPWMAANMSASSGWKHYLLAGTDEYVDVIARDWHWILGPPAS